jgi:Na+/proline symporter
MGAFLNMFIWMTCTAGSDQMAIQRYLATRDVRTARRSFGIHLATEVLISVLLALVGLAVLGYFQANPEQLGSGMSLEKSADKLLPRFIVVGLPAGLTGLVIAALLSAAMSSLSSGMNASSAVITTDFIGRFRSQPLTQYESVRLARFVSVAVGLLALLLSNVVPYLATNLLEVCMNVVNLLTTPLFVLFFLALFVPWARPIGSIAATIASVTVAVDIAYLKGFLILHAVGPAFENLDFLGTAPERLEFLWTAPAAFTTGVVVGMLASLLPGGRQPERTAS